MLRMVPSIVHGPPGPYTAAMDGPPGPSMTPQTVPLKQSEAPHVVPLAITGPPTKSVFDTNIITQKRLHDVMVHVYILERRWLKYVRGNIRTTRRRFQTNQR